MSMEQHNSGNSRIAKNTMVLYIRMIFVLLVSLYSTRAILNALGVVDYGIYNVVAGFVSMFAFLNSSMTNTIQRFFNYERGRNDANSLNKVYITSFQIQFLLGIITFVLLEIVGVWYISTKMILPVERLSAAMCVFHFSVISLFLLILQIPYAAAVIAHEKMTFYAIVSITDAVLKLLIAIVLPYIHYDRLIYYGFLMLVISIVNLLLYFFYAKRFFAEIKYQNCFHKHLFKKMLAFSGWNVFGAFAYTMQGQGLNMLMNAFFGPIVNAARGVAYQVQAALSGFTENIAVAFKPQLVECYAKGDFERTKYLMYSMSKLGYVMVFVLSLPVSLEIEYILKIWLGGGVPQNTAIFTILILFNMVLCSLNLPISQTVQAVGNIRNYQTFRSAIVMSVLPISWIALSNGLPAYWVFIILILVNIINQLASMFLLKRVFSYSYKEYTSKVIIPCILFSIVVPIVPFVVHFLFMESFVRLLIVGLLSVLVSIVFLYWVIMTRNEKVFVKNIVNKVLNK